MRQLVFVKRLLMVHFKTALQQEIAFRSDFLIKILYTCLELVGSIGGLLIIFSQVNSINGWQLQETFVVAGMFLLIQNVKNLFIGPSLSSISGLGGDLWTGKFDFTLLKPIPTQLYISIKKWSPLASIDLLMSLAVLVFALNQLDTPIFTIDICTFVVSIFVSLTLLYSLMLVLTSVAFWYLGTPLLWIFDTMMQMGRYPVGIYPVAFRFILTWIIPVGFMISVPAEALLGQANLLKLGSGLIFTVVFYLLALTFFTRSIRKYSSASS